MKDDTDAQTVVIDFYSLDNDRTIGDVLADHARPSLEELKNPPKSHEFPTMPNEQIER